ncbi:MAG: hypothetical protein SOR93_11390, partial [Clostridiales Family XIII bacterium]|nr:hypothetical protein [Clostridiales Family XIII bacterium]
RLAVLQMNISKKFLLCATMLILVTILMSMEGVRSSKQRLLNHTNFFIYILCNTADLRYPVAFAIFPQFTFATGLTEVGCFIFRCLPSKFIEVI